MMKNLKTCVLAAFLLALAAPGAKAQEEQAGTGGGALLFAGAGWSSTRGAVGQIGLRGENILESGIDADLEHREGETGQDGRLRLRYRHKLGDTGFGSDSRLILETRHGRSNWDEDGYSATRSRISLGISADLSESFDYHFGVFWQENAVADLRSTTSPLIHAAQGHSDAAGIEASVRFGRLDQPVLPRFGQSLELNLTSALAGDRRFRALEAIGTIARSPHPDWTVALRLGGGVIEGRKGQELAIYDRAFLGGKAPRGFGQGGVGPRDYTASGVDTPLGGRNYVLASLELRHRFSPRFAVGAFVDAGSVWKLDGAPVGASGLIDDSRYLRSAAGLAFYWSSSFGTINVNITDPLSHQPHDSLNRLSLNLISAF